jgi:hypothetical protein
MNLPPSSGALAPGTRLGRYEITGFVAAGGNGESARLRDRETAPTPWPPAN